MLSTAKTLNPVQPDAATRVRLANLHAFAVSHGVDCITDHARGTVTISQWARNANGAWFTESTECSTAKQLRGALGY